MVFSDSDHDVRRRHICQRKSPLLGGPHSIIRLFKLSGLMPFNRVAVKTGDARVARRFHHKSRQIAPPFHRRRHTPLWTMAARAHSLTPNHEALAKENTMIRVDDALALVLALANPPVAEDVGVADALGRALLAPAVARLTQPPFDASAMDGYALRGAELPGPFDVIGTAAAGVPYEGATPPGTAVRIFTGAPVPPGYDRVVMQEHVTRDADQITVSAPTDNANIRAAGNDFVKGAQFRPNRALRASDLGLIAAMNVSHVSVARRPRVAVLAGGDELVLPGQQPAPGQIISSNDIAIAALAREAGAQVEVLPLARDTEASLREGFAAARDADLLVTIGGASVGDHDLIGKVSADLGMQRAFYKLAMRPGKPLMAGRIPGRIPGGAMLGLPGNPVSAIVCAKLFMQPLIRAMQGLPPGPDLAQATLACDLPAEGDRQHYYRARLQIGSGLPHIAPFSDQDSARLWILAEADALLMRPANDPPRRAGEQVSYLML